MRTPLMSFLTRHICIFTENSSDGFKNFLDFFLTIKNRERDVNKR